MDENKLRTLKEVGYKVRSCCGLCLHADLERTGWGTCKVQTYNHKKHTDSKRSLSIFQYGSCDQFSQDPKQISKLGTFKTFITVG